MFFRILFPFGRTVSQSFCEADEAARWSLRSFLCSMCFTVALSFLWGSSSWGDCQWEPAAMLSCKIWDTANLPVLAFLNAKRHGVGQCWLSAQPSSLVKGPAHHHLTADQAGMLSRVEGSGTLLCVDSNKSSLQLLNHPPPPLCPQGWGRCG